MPFPPGNDVTTSQEIVDGAPFVRIWFRTAGCTYDRQGLCTMCNYGVGEPVTDSVVDAIAAALDEVPLDDRATVLVSPSGSMFDPREVPDAIRQSILAAVARSSAGTVLCETRPETVTGDRMAEFALLLGDKAGVIEMGLESADPWVLQWLVNKKLDLEEFRAATETCHRHGLRVLANVSLGTAMLSPRHAIEDAERSIRWAIDAGVDACVVFPLHVREWTLLSWLWRHNRYQPVSLWSLVEVLQRVGRDYPGRVSAAWYRDYDDGVGEVGAATSMPILTSPTSCPDCAADVETALDEYRDSADTAVLDRLVERACPCRTEWLRTLDEPPFDVGEAYQSIGNAIMGPAWWDARGADVIKELWRAGGTAGDATVHPIVGSPIGRSEGSRR